MGMANLKPHDFIHDIWQGVEGSTVVSTNGHTQKSAIETVDNKGGLVGFGRLFMPNPDLPFSFHLLKNIALVRGDQATWYMPSNFTPAGYSDWPFAAENDQ
ncbi:hypothetical protein BDR03DRAFT_975493 [Suillus americanus]|nr:hypothetical protein BDR03DRAFT_975493 [Suillus americanus]